MLLVFQATAIVVHAVCVSVQGKRVACEDGSDGYSDLYQESAMLQRENDTLRLRVKAMQETIDRLNTRITHLLANEVSTLLTKSSTSTVLHLMSYSFIYRLPRCILNGPLVCVT